MTTEQTLNLRPGEHWWGGAVQLGVAMPFGDGPAVCDIRSKLHGNQANPLMISDQGRYVWSDQPCIFTFEAGRLAVQGGGVQQGHSPQGTLRGGYQEACGKFFPPSGGYPEPLLFTAPQYNLWIECLYEPTQERVLNYARQVLACGMPPGVIMIDDLWQDIAYGTWRFHGGRFADPAGMCRRLHEMGFKVMLWLCPFVTPDSLVFRELEARGLLVKDAAGKTAIRQWWNGHSALLDCTNPAAVEWLTGCLRGLQELGVDGFKFDGGDPNYYRDDDRIHAPAGAHEQCAAWVRVGLNYRLNEYRACWKMAGQPLAQRLSDKCHSWGNDGLAALIPNGLAQGLLGYAFTCPDMIAGGEYKSFLSPTFSLDQELFVRSAQCSALFPMMQFSLAPWRVLDAEHLACCVEAARLHARFGPRIEQLAAQAARDGEPIIRHMEYAFPHQGYAAIRDQFMLGEDILVAPVLTKGARSRQVAFPPGRWLGDDGQAFGGPCTETIDAPLSRLPYFERAKV